VGPGAGSILDSYVRTAPCAQNAIGVFANEWWSKFPSASGIQAGTVDLFEDGRIKRMLEAMGGIAGKRVLELGPLEGGHSYMLEQAGAASVVAIEANTRAYLKCLISKELLGMSRVRFLCGDFREYLAAASERFDLCLACGVLYHMRNPAELLESVARCADAVYLWTHYFDAEKIARIPALATSFGPRVEAEHKGFRHSLWPHEYGRRLAAPSFCGGAEPAVCWMARDDILGCLRHFGYDEVRVLNETPDTPVFGPAIEVLARRVVPR
jgi:SAM-dependent methyltransferase